MSCLEIQLMGASSRLLPFFEDPEVTDILINGSHAFFVERNGTLQQLTPPFEQPQMVWDLIERLVVPIGKRVVAARPYLDGRMVDGSRFHVILPPLAVNGPVVSIRKHRRASLGLDDFGAAPVVHMLRDAFVSGKNMLIAGGTGAGKTTLLSRLLDCVGSQERLVLVEETQELSTEHPHVVQLEARPPSAEGTGEVTLRMLVRNALRMRPNRLILGECRGEEAWDLLQAMNTGHPGSACTLHANSPLDGLRRLETLVLMSGVRVTLETVREWISSAIQWVVFVERVGTQREIAGLVEILGMEGNRYRMHPRMGRQAVAAVR